MQLRFLGWVISLGLVLLFGMATYQYTESLRNDIFADAAATLHTEAEQQATRMREDIETNIDIVKFLHTTPPIAGITRALSHQRVDPYDGTTLEQWCERLETIFQSLIENNSDIRQLRLISVEQAGQEFLRVDREAGRVRVMPKTRLQNKQSEPYYHTAAALKAGEVYVSSINLNKEYGKIVYPFQPTYRIALAIFYEDGTRFGFLIMNIDAGSLLTPFLEAKGLADEFWLVDNEGYFVSTPKAAKRFTQQLDPNVTLQNLYQIERDEVKGLLLSDKQGHRQWIADEKIIFQGADTERRLFIYAVMSYAKVEQLAKARRNEVLYFLGGALGFVLLVLAMFFRSYSTSKKLNKVNSTFEAIVAGASDVVICITPQGIVKAWNNAAVSLFSTPKYLALNKSIEQLVALDQHLLSELIKKTIASQSTHAFSDSITWPNQVKSYVELSISPIQDNTASGIDSLVINLRDVTESVQAKEALEQYNAELEEKVEERTQTLQEYSHQLKIAHQQAMEASDAKSNFIATISHEMRTPLNGMMGSLGLMRQDPLSPKQQKYLSMAESSVDTLAVLINDILDLSKIESGKLEINLQRFSPRPLIETLIQTCALKAYEKGVNVVVDTSDIDHSRLYSDPNRIKQILNNLMSNAIKFTQQGEIKIIAATQELDSNTVRLSVEVIDSGIGIAVENQHRLFQRFSQEGSDTAVKFGGTGLGLSICRELCELMNGKIDFESNSGEGSRFYFHIDMDASLCRLSELSQALKGQQIGVVTTDQSLASVLSKNLSSWGGGSLLLDNDAPVLGELDALILDGDLLDEQAWLARYQAANCSLPPIIISLSYNNTLGPHLLEGEPALVKLAKPLVSDDLLDALQGRVQASLMSLEASQQEQLHYVDLSGLRILLVDDNQINLEVARGYLEPRQAEISCASNGRECLELVKQAHLDGKPFDCILLDCQMPVMNGYECASELRYNAKDYGSASIPIIAMTANAFAGEKEKCLSYGMSDYLTKPVDPKILLDKVEQWTAEAREARSRTSPSAPANRDYQGWNRAAALSRMRGAEHLLNKVLDIFLDSSTNYMQSLGLVVEQQDAPAIGEWSHKIKGFCSEIGAEHLAAIMADIEQQTRRQADCDFALIMDYYQQAKQEHQQLLAAISESRQPSAE
ncbi:ATP-binding protein [Agarivorans sp.]|uniref:ATP-binding protein n=1 Tax=Agarivorans sp. TaxID=1872412 RepID=UPI003D07EB27